MIQWTMTRGTEEDRSCLLPWEALCRQMVVTSELVHRRTHIVLVVAEERVLSCSPKTWIRRCCT